MIVTRRRMIEAGGGLFLAALLAKPALSAGSVVDVEMHGKDDGAHVWFDPIGIHIEPGQTILWANRDPGNSHTVTAYHPDMVGRIVVGLPPALAEAAATPGQTLTQLPDIALNGFPPVDEIIAKGIVRKA